MTKHWIQAASLSAMVLAVAHLPVCAQSTQPRAPSQPRSATELRLSEKPVLSIGLFDGPDEYLFADVNSGARLTDGSVVVSDQQHLRVQRFSAEGEHLWSRGRKGEGPGEFQRVQIAEGCASEALIVAYDARNRRISVFDGEGSLSTEYPMAYNELPLRDVACAHGGHLGFLGFSVRKAEEGVEPGELYRELVSVGAADLGSEATMTLRDEIPHRELMLYGPGISALGSVWAHEVVLAVTQEGVWLGTSEDYEVELIDWTGATLRRIRWEGPDLKVTRQDINGHREALEEEYRDEDDPDWRVRFERAWEQQREIVPEEFPAYDRLLTGDDGVLWVHDYIRPGERSEWFGFDEGGRWVSTLVLPARTYLLDIGADWALVRTLDDLGVQRVEVRGMVEA